MHFQLLAKNFTQYATIITIALNSYAARYITVSYHNNDMEKAQEYISSVYYGDVAISAVIMIVAGGFILFLDRILNISLELVTSVKQCSSTGMVRSINMLGSLETLMTLS